MRRISLPAVLAKAVFVAACAVTGCSSEILERQAQQIKEQATEITRQRKEIDELLASRQAEQQKRRDCNQAFRDYFEVAQAVNDRDKAIGLYRSGLALCPDDEIAHYELGKVLAERGSYADAEKEFEAALKSNPDFIDAQNQLEAARRRK
jgi:tetratricopeptide (TPR) repeat protein